MKKHIFITGAAGFIGFHLAKALHDRGERVLGYDNFNDYYTPELKRARAKELKKVGIEVVTGDICDAALLEASVRRHATTHMVHLAAQAGVRYSLVNPQAYVQANLEGFTTILQICRHATLKLTYASSSSVYGLNTKVPFSEKDPTDRPASFYGATKKSNELMAHTYHHLYGIAVTGLRYFTVYGPWGRPDMAYYTFAKAIQEEQTIHLYNHGDMQRDFTYIDDIIAGTIAAIDHEAPCEVFNLGNHHPEPVATLVNLLEKYMGKKAKIALAPMQPGDVPATYADISHSEALLGFHPRTPLDQGIAKFVEWFKNTGSQ